MNLHLGPGVSISTPDVLMGSAEKLHSHGIVTALWTMRVICLALLPAVSPPPPHSCSPPTHQGLTAGARLHVTESLSQEGEMPPPLHFPAAFRAWFVLAGLKGRRVLACFQRGVLYMCIPSVAKLPQEQHILSVPLPCPACARCLCQGRILTWPCGGSNALPLYTQVQCQLPMLVWVQ